MKRILLTLVWIFAATVICSAQTTIHYPHIVNGSLGGHSYKTTIFLSNPGAPGTPALNATILLFKEVAPIEAEGVPLSITFTDQSGVVTSGSSISVSNLGPGQSRKLVSTGTGAFSTGFAVVLSNSAIAGTATFSDFDGAGRLIAEAGIPSALALPRQAIFVDTVGGYNVGVAIANPDGVPAPMTLTLLNTSGVTVASTPLTLGAGNHKAAFPNELFSPLSIPPMTGTMQITSSIGLVSIALRYDPTFTIFTTLPPVSIASLVNPAMQWLAQQPLLKRIAPIARLLVGLRFGLG